MKAKKRKFIYFNNLGFEGTVFQTQIIGWLNLYQQADIVFELIQMYSIKHLFNHKFLKKQSTGIKKSTSLFGGYVLFFPSKKVFSFLNGIILSLRLLKYVFGYQEILIFSRAQIGNEIIWLKRLLPVSVIFIFDGRAAAAEERKYIANKKNDFSYKEFQLIAFLYKLECLTLSIASKVFVVSNVLKTYYSNTYKIPEDKFVYYPCLSDASKFYYNENLRMEIRDHLKIASSTKIFLYSGGVSSEWHISEKMFQFFDRINKIAGNVHFLFLTTDAVSIKTMCAPYKGLFEKVSCFSLPNDQVVKYLNAADYGILFRENTIMNNVASPTKFAEYVLCGLPVIISEGVGDYTMFTANHNIGLVLNENEMIDVSENILNNILDTEFSRNEISELGKKYFSKSSILPQLVRHFKAD